MGGRAQGDIRLGDSVLEGAECLVDIAYVNARG